MYKIIYENSLLLLIALNYILPKILLIKKNYNYNIFIEINNNVNIIIYSALLKVELLALAFNFLFSLMKNTLLNSFDEMFENCP